MDAKQAYPKAEDIKSYVYDLGIFAIKLKNGDFVSFYLKKPSPYLNYLKENKIKEA